MEGYIKISRRFFDNPLWTEPREYSRAEAWIDLIQSAKFEAQSLILNGRAIEVQRGEIVASRRYLEIRWKWSNTKVDNFLKLLTDQGMITKRNASQNTVITLTNYSTYNDVNAIENATQTPTKRQQNATQTPNIKKEKKVKKEKHIPPISPVGGVSECDDKISDDPLKTTRPEGEEKSCAKKENPAFEKFRRWIDDNAPNVGRMKEPFTASEFEKLKQDFTIGQIQNTLRAMHNWKPLLTKNVNANLTFRKWAAKETSGIKLMPKTDNDREKLLNRLR